MKKLLEKLAEVKKEIGKISKNAENPYFKSRYFDINALLEHTEPLLEKYKLMCLQPIDNNKVCSIIFDIESGESIKSEIELPQQNDPQKLGSAITYFRRYTLQSLLGLQAEDDDGNKAKPEAKPVKQTINPKSDLWDKCVKAIAEGKRTIDDAKAKYDITAKDLVLLEQHVESFKMNLYQTQND